MGGNQERGVRGVYIGERCMGGEQPVLQQLHMSHKPLKKSYYYYYITYFHNYYITYFHKVMHADVLH